MILPFLHFYVVSFQPVKIRADLPNQCIIADRLQIMLESEHYLIGGVAGGYHALDILITLSPSHSWSNANQTENCHQKSIHTKGWGLRSPKHHRNNDKDNPCVHYHFRIGQRVVKIVGASHFVLFVFRLDDPVYTLDDLPIFFLTNALFKLLWSFIWVEGESCWVDFDQHGLRLKIFHLFHFRWHNQIHISSNKNPNSGILCQVGWSSRS